MFLVSVGILLLLEIVVEVKLDLFSHEMIVLDDVLNAAVGLNIFGDPIDIVRNHGLFFNIIQSC